jgi:hypothetical protein
MLQAESFGGTSYHVRDRGMVVSGC